MLHKAVQFLQMVAEQDIRFLIIYAIMFGFILFAMYQIIRYEQAHGKFLQIFARWKADAAEQERLREDEYRRQLELEGEFKDKNKLRKITKKLQDSGLRRKLPEMTAQMFLLMVFLVSIVIGVITFFMVNSILVAIMAGFLTWIGIYILLEIKITQNYVAIEREIIKFINILENMSYSEGNIAEMLGATVPYLSEPLKSSVEKCYYEIKATGNASAALQHLVDRTNYRKLKETFNALRVCAQHNEDYESVIEESKESIRTFITYRKINNRIKVQSLIDMAVMGGFGIMIIYMLSSMVDNAKQILFQSFIGQALLLAAVCLMIYGIWSILKTDDQ